MNYISFILGSVAFVLGVVGLYLSFRNIMEKNEYLEAVIKHDLNEMSIKILSLQSHMEREKEINEHSHGVLASDISDIRKLMKGKEARK